MDTKKLSKYQNQILNILRDRGPVTRRGLTRILYGREITRSQSAALSRSLKRLRDRGLVKQQQQIVGIPEHYPFLDNLE